MYYQDVPWSQVTVSQNGSPPVFLDQTTTNGWIRSPLYTWTGSACASLAAGGTFQPLRGSWLNAVNSGLLLLFPKP